MCITDNNIIIDKINKLTLQLVSYICILLKRFFGVSLGQEIGQWIKKFKRNLTVDFVDLTSDNWQVYKH